MKMTDFDELDPAEQFSARINLSMARALEDGGDPDELATIAANTAYELYEHYGAGEGYDSFGEFAVDVAFQADETDQWLDNREE